MDASGMGALAGAVPGYLLGSVPFGLVLTRLTGAGDLRAIGSGNIGATNVLRTGRKGLAAATLLLDMGKGALAVWLGARLVPLLLRQPAGDLRMALGAAAGAMIGHCFPVWLRFRGGKGVATMLGVALGLAWPVGLIAALAWLVVARASRISSLGGMASALAAPVALALGGASVLAGGRGLPVPLLASPEAAGERAACVVVLALLAALVVLMHRANIARLAAGTEPRIGAGK